MIGLRGLDDDGKVGTFEEDLERCISPGKGRTRDMFIRDVRTCYEDRVLIPWDGLHFGRAIWFYFKMAFETAVCQPLKA